MKKHIPNLVTLLNLLTGVTGIIMIMENRPGIAAYLVFLAGFLDFLDGMFARWLKAYSSVGKSLDSLADLVSFGVIPGLLFYFAVDKFPFQPGSALSFLPWIGLLIPAFTAIRLARFNHDSEQALEFKGLPSPANAFLIASGFLMFIEYPNPRLALLIIFTLSSLIGCLLMISDLHMASLKNPGSRNKIFFFILPLFIASLVLLFIFGPEGIFFIILFYILLSLGIKKIT